MVEPIGCKRCGGEFCPAHRYEADHACVGSLLGNEVHNGTQGRTAKLKDEGRSAHTSSPISNVVQVMEQSKKKLLDSLSTPSSGNGNAGNSNGNANNATSTPKAKGKVDHKRALAEQASARKGLEMRAKKGCVSV